MIVKTTQEPRSDIDSLIEQANAAAEEICVVGRNGQKAVLIGEDDWRSIQETLHLQSIPGMVESIRQAAAEPLDKGVEWKKADWGNGKSS